MSDVRAGLIVRVGERHYLLAAESVLRVAVSPPVQRVPGAPAELLGIAMEGGTVVPVLALVSTSAGEAVGSLLICQVGGEPLGLAGAEVVATGFFPRAPEAHGPGAVIFRGEHGKRDQRDQRDQRDEAVGDREIIVEPLDLGALLERVQPGPWAGGFLRVP